MRIYKMSDAICMTKDKQIVGCSDHSISCTFVYPHLYTFTEGSNTILLCILSSSIEEYIITPDILRFIRVAYAGAGTGSTSAKARIDNSDICVQHISGIPYTYLIVNGQTFICEYLKGVLFP